MQTSGANRHFEELSGVTAQISATCARFYPLTVLYIGINFCSAI